MQPCITRGGLLAVIGILFSVGTLAPHAAAQDEAAAQGNAAAQTEALTAKGAWSAAVTYHRDDIVTARGSTWRAKKLNKGKVPGQTQPSTAAFWELLAAGFNPKGAWLSTRKYQPNDLVTATGSTWRAKRTNINKAPVAGPNWEQFAARGAAGPNTGVPAGTQTAPAISFDGDSGTGVFSPEPGKIALVENGALILHNLGSNNTALGFSALASNTIGGVDNTAVGASALAANADGDFNTALGSSALATNTSGFHNIALGHFALFSNTTGTYNTAVGSSALGFNIIGDRNVAVGVGALAANTTGNDNTAVGMSALSNSNGGDNTAVGRAALIANTTGAQNTAVGSLALGANTTGNQNTAVGTSALDSNTTGLQNTAVGHLALAANTTGGVNIAVGGSALRSNTTGSINIAVGRDALRSNSTGLGNVVLGDSALFLNTDGDDNIAVGRSAGLNALSPEASIFIGNTGLPSDDATIKIGTQGTQQTTFIAGIAGAPSAGGVAVFVNGGGQLSTATSSRRYKKEIQSIGDVGPMLARLRPVTFRYRHAVEDGAKPLQYGLIAEEVEEISRDLVAYNKDGSVETVRYHFLPPLLLAGWQAQQKTIEAQAERIEAQADEIAELKRRLAAIEASLPRTKAAALQ